MIQIAESFWCPNDPSIKAPRLFVSSYGYASVRPLMTRKTDPRFPYDRYIYRPSQLLGYPRFGFTLWVYSGFPVEADRDEWFYTLMSRGISRAYYIYPRSKPHPDPARPIPAQIISLRKLLYEIS